MKITNLKKLKSLMLSKERLSYNTKGKERFRDIGRKAMKELAEILSLKEFDIDFTPYGIAVSGDLRLMGMWSEGNGIYITMNKDFPNAPYGQVLYRTITHMKDFTGGSNCWFNFSDLDNVEEIQKTMSALNK